MVCSNCKSRDVIKVQDQFFCVNCGNLVTSSTSPALPDTSGLPSGIAFMTPSGDRVEIAESESESSSTSTQVAEAAPLRDEEDTLKVMPRKTTPVAIIKRSREARETQPVSDGLVKKRRPGRPKLGPLDAPKLLASSPSKIPESVVIEGSVPVAAVMSNDSLRSHHVLTLRPESLPGRVSQSNDLEEDQAPARKVETVEADSHAENLPPVRLTKPAPTRNKSQSAEPSDEASVTDIKPRHPQPFAPNDASVAAHRSGEPVVFGSVVAASIRDRFDGRFLTLSLGPAVVLALLAMAVVYVTGSAGMSVAVQRTVAGGLPFIAQLGLIGCIYYVSRSFVSSAIMYGVARQYDHRPARAYSWLQVAAAALPERIVYDVWSLAQLVLLLAAIGALIRFGGLSLPLPEWLHVVLLFCGFLVLLYAFVGVLLAQGLGRVAITLSRISVLHASSLGISFFKRHFELVGIKVLMLIVEIILAIPVLLVVAAVLLLTPSVYMWLVMAGIGLAVAVTGASVGAGTAIWWQATYRRLVRTERLTEAVGLLSGRSPRTSGHYLGPYGVLGVLLLMTIGAAVIPWLLP